MKKLQLLTAFFLSATLFTGCSGIASNNASKDGAIEKIMPCES